MRWNQFLVVGGGIGVAGPVDERDCAAFGELAMARSPMRRVGRPDPPDADGAPDSSAALRRDRVPRRGRPGKRW